MNQTNSTLSASIEGENSKRIQNAAHAPHDETGGETWHTLSVCNRNSLVVPGKPRPGIGECDEKTHDTYCRVFTKEMEAILGSVLVVELKWQVDQGVSSCLHVAFENEMKFIWHNAGSGRHARAR